MTCFLLIYIWFQVQICAIAYFSEYIYRPLGNLRLSGLVIFQILYIFILWLVYQIKLLKKNENVCSAFTIIGVLFFVLKFILDIAALIVYYCSGNELKLFIVSVFVDIFLDLAVFGVLVTAKDKFFGEFDDVVFNYSKEKIVSNITYFR